MYEIVREDDGTAEATLTVAGLTFRSRKYLDTLHPAFRVPGMDLRIVKDCVTDEGQLGWSAWDDNEFIACADTPEILISKIRAVLSGRMLNLVSTYNALFPLTPATAVI